MSGRLILFVPVVLLASTLAARAGTVVDPAALLGPGNQLTEITDAVNGLTLTGHSTATAFTVPAKAFAQATSKPGSPVEAAFAWALVVPGTTTLATSTSFGHLSSHSTELRAVFADPVSAFRVEVRGSPSTDPTLEHSALVLAYDENGGQIASLVGSGLVFGASETLLLTGVGPIHSIRITGADPGNAGTPGDVVWITKLEFTSLNAVPLPSAGALGVLGLVMIGLGAWRRSR